MLKEGFLPISPCIRITEATSNTVDATAMVAIMNGFSAAIAVNTAETAVTTLCAAAALAMPYVTGVATSSAL